MNISIIIKEIKSKALQEIAKDLNMIVEDVRNHNISYQQGNMEIVGRKHIIQSIALDWAFNSKHTIKYLK